MKSITFLSESMLVTHGGCMLSNSTKGMSIDRSDLVYEVRQHVIACFFLGHLPVQLSLPKSWSHSSGRKVFYDL